MTKHPAQYGLCGFITLVLAAGFSGPARAQQMQPSGIQQIQTILEEKTTKSRSKNSPFFGLTLQGRVAGIVNGEKVSLNKPA